MSADRPLFRISSGEVSLRVWLAATGLLACGMLGIAGGYLAGGRDKIGVADAQASVDSASTLAAVQCDSRVATEIATALVPVKENAENNRQSALGWKNRADELDVQVKELQTKLDVPTSTQYPTQTPQTPTSTPDGWRCGFVSRSTQTPTATMKATVTPFSTTGVPIIELTPPIETTLTPTPNDTPTPGGGCEGDCGGGGTPEKSGNPDNGDDRGQPGDPGDDSTIPDQP